MIFDEVDKLLYCLLHKKPYFGSLYCVRQGEDARHRWFRAVVRAALEFRPDDGGKFRLLEIGSYAGFSTATWFEALRRECKDFEIYCVDPFQPYFDNTVDNEDIYVSMNNALNGGNAHKMFWHNMDTLGASPFIRLLKEPSETALKGLEGESFDIVFVDGNHQFENALFDIRMGKLLTRELGILCGDDLEIQAQDLSIDVLANALASSRDVTSEQGVGPFHPGVTAAVSQVLGKVEERDGFWAIQKGSQGKVLCEERAWYPPHIVDSVHQETGDGIGIRFHEVITAAITERDAAITENQILLDSHIWKLSRPYRSLRDLLSSQISGLRKV